MDRMEELASLVSEPLQQRFLIDLDQIVLYMKDNIQVLSADLTSSLQTAIDQSICWQPIKKGLWPISVSLYYRATYYLKNMLSELMPMMIVFLSMIARLLLNGISPYYCKISIQTLMLLPLPFGSL